ncbi:hypothetical protein C8J56DRAFT_1005309 [Mycena floridula]|nr:hypothetical protein C8J56DRAFT_1005309 [Mycena floridula]
MESGSVVKWLLKEPGFTIRAVTRNPDSSASKQLIAQGIGVVTADLSNIEETAAFKGAWGVFGLTQFYEHRYGDEQLHGQNIVEAYKAADVKHVVRSTVKGHEGECAAISRTSKAKIEDRIIKSGIPWTFNFLTSFFAPTYDDEKGFNWSVEFLPDVPVFAFRVEDLGAWDLATQLIEVTDSQFKASRYADPAAEFIYLS